MADFMKLNDGTVIQIEGGASLFSIVHVATSETDGVNVARAITEDNLLHVEFFSNLNSAEDVENAAPNGEYDYLAPVSAYFDVSNMRVLISLREKSDFEKRLDAIDEEQELQNEAIDFLAMM